MTSTRFGAVVFDMDGLMFDTESLYVDVGKRICAQWGKAFTTEIQNAMAGIKGDEAIVIMLDMLGVDADARQVYEHSQDLFVELADTELRCMPGLLELLDRLEAARMPKIVATSSPRDLTDHLLGKFDLGKRFDMILVGEDVANSKPHPEMYELAARRLDLPPERCLVLEDSINGMLAAKAAGAFCVVVPNLFAQNEDFSQADLRLDTLADPALYQTLGLPAL